MIVSAESLLDDVIKSVKDGSVTVATLRQLKQHTSQFLKLCEVQQTSQTGGQNESVEKYFCQRVSELDAFFTLEGQLKCFITFCNNLTSGRQPIFIKMNNVLHMASSLPCFASFNKMSPQAMIDILVLEVDSMLFLVVLVCVFSQMIVNN